MTNNIKKIFISHSHKDEKYVAELVQLIKVTNVEASSDVEIICSSFPGHEIPIDVNIYEYLKEALRKNVWVIYVLSKNYYDSAACLNEMGATWIQNHQYSTFLTPNYSFTKITGAIDPSKTAYLINDKTRLNDFKNKILSTFNLTLKDNLWESVRDQALNNLNGIAKLERENNLLEKVSFETRLLII